VPAAGSTRLNPEQTAFPEAAVQTWNLSSRTACGASTQDGSLELTLLFCAAEVRRFFAGASEDFFVAQTLPLAGSFEEIFEGQF
jgi:hypothetical protein